MGRGFLKGIILGGIAGTLAVAYYWPQMRPKPHRILMKKGRKLGRQTGRLVSEAAREMSSMVRNRMH